jgi:hypothetical protein
MSDNDVDMINNSRKKVDKSKFKEYDDYEEDQSEQEKKEANVQKALKLSGLDAFRFRSVTDLSSSSGSSSSSSSSSSSVNNSHNSTNSKFKFVSKTTTANEKNSKEKENETDKDEYSNKSVTATNGGRDSRFYNLNMNHHLEFLKEPCLSRGSYLQNMTELQRLIFDYLVAIRPTKLLKEIICFPQKSAQWKWARNGRITGSSTGSAIGYHREYLPLTTAWKSVYTTFNSNVATEWGSEKEAYAARCYVEDLNRLVSTVFRAQRLSGYVKQHGGFEFRGQFIPVTNIDKDPEVAIRHYGLIIDPWCHWRGVSPDGIIEINGVVVGCLEIKCPYAKQHSLYPTLPKYYFTQLQCEMYISRLFWPDVCWLDFVVWSPTHWTCETIPFEEEWFYSYYGPRELRYYFNVYLPAIAEKIWFDTKKRAGDKNYITKEDVLLTLQRDLSFPHQRS